MRAPLFFVACLLAAGACSVVEDSLESVPPGPRRTTSGSEPRSSDAALEAEATVDDASTDAPVIVDAPPPIVDAGDDG